MKAFTILLLAFSFYFNATSQTFFSPTEATASPKEHVKFMKANKTETEKRAGLWKVSPFVVQLIASVQSGAGTQSGFNYGAVLPIAPITKYAKFSKVDNKGLIACEKKSRGIEAIALALNAIQSKTGLKKESDILTFVFGMDGDLVVMAPEAEKAYQAYTGKEIILAPKEIALPEVVDIPNERRELNTDEVAKPAEPQGRRIVKDPLKEIAEIETYEPGINNVIKKEKQDTNAQTELTIRPEVEMTAEEIQSKEKRSSDAQHKHNTAAEEATLKEAELKKAAMTEAEKREAKIKEAAELVMKQREAAKKRRQKKENQKNIRE